jgi:hypothetical protein
MIVFDLKCGSGHVFEAWFSSSSAFEQQKMGRLIACPLCGDSDVSKAVMAPNIAAKSNAAASVPVAVSNTSDVTEKAPDEVKAFLKAAAAVQAKLLETSTWVGRSFADKARDMDAGLAPKATIHGEVTRDEAKALIEEGVGVMPLPFPVIAPGKQN